MKFRLPTVFAALAAALLLAGCDGRQSYEVRGVIKEIKPGHEIAIIEHEQIPGYMAAMTMPFDVKNTNELAGLQPYDRVSFRMVVTKEDGWIENVKKIGVAPPPPPAPAPTNAAAQTAGTNDTGTNLYALRDTFRRSPNVNPLAPGDAMHDWKYTNHLGRPFSFHQLTNTAYAFTFIFTRCPFPDFCPRMNNHFAKALRGLQSRPETNWLLLSLSFDPEFDTPAVLQRYARQYGADGARWQFAISDLWNIDGLADQFGLVFPREGGTFNHNLRTVVVDARGRVQKIFTGNTWQPDELVAELAAAARVKN